MWIISVFARNEIFQGQMESQKGKRREDAEWAIVDKFVPVDLDCPSNYQTLPFWSYDYFFYHDVSGKEDQFRVKFGNTSVG